MLTLIALFSPDKPEYLKNPLTGILVLFFLSMAIQVLFSYDPDLSWAIFYNRVIKFSFMAFFIVSFVRSPKGLILFTAAFMLACMKMGQEGMVGQLTGSMIWENQGVMRLHGSTPLYAHPNSYSGMALGTIPFILYLYQIVPKWVKVLFVIQFVFAFNIILHSGSRTGYVAFIAMLLFWFLRSQKRIVLFIGIAFVLYIGVPFIDDQYVARFNTIITGQEIEGNSIGARLQIIEDAVAVFLDHPFGVGVGAFPVVRMDMFGRSQDTHNLYLEIATNLGIQGFAIFFVLIIKIYSILRKSETIKKSGIDLSSNFLTCISRSLQLYIFTRLLLGVFGMDLYEIYWWFSIGLTISIYNINNTECVLSDEK
jgi:hypothetical protein